MAEIEKLQAFKTSDGNLHEHQMDALNHQKWLNFSKWCRENICIGGEWSASMVATEIWDKFVVTPHPQTYPTRVEVDDDIPF
jgi:hypothetical protein